MINIFVDSRPAQGKTTIAFLIEKALKDAGFTDVTVHENEMTEASVAKLRGDLAARAQHIAKRNQKIHIRTRQMSRVKADETPAIEKRVVVDAEGQVTYERVIGAPK